MPHMVLRHSSNLSGCDFIPFFSKLHEILVKNLGVKSSSCSSMVITHNQYLVGDGTNNAFVHLDIKVKPSINLEFLKLTGTESFNLLKKHVSNYNNLNIKVSVDFLTVSPFFKS